MAQSSAALLATARGFRLAALVSVTAISWGQSVTFTEYTIPTLGSQPTSIAAGPDGALWFTESGSNKIGRITTAGVITEYSSGLNAGSEPIGQHREHDGVGRLGVNLMCGLSWHRA